MKKYRVEYAHWVDGYGCGYVETIDVETIDNTDELLTEEELGEYYGEYCESSGDEIRLTENDTDEIVEKFEC